MPYAPLPGTESPVRGLFVDRWGTLLAPPQRGYCTQPSEIAFEPGAVDALFRAQQGGWSIYLLGNEDAVAFGHLSESVHERIHAAILEELAAMGVAVTRSYACLDNPAGQGDHAKPSVFLLPETGAFFHAAQFEGVRLDQSWVIGDSTLEIAAAERAGLHTMAVRTGLGLSDRTLHVEPEVVCDTLRDAIDTLLSIESFVRP